MASCYSKDMSAMNLSRLKKSGTILTFQTYCIVLLRHSLANFQHRQRGRERKKKSFFKDRNKSTPRNSPLQFSPLRMQHYIEFISELCQNVCSAYPSLESCHCLQWLTSAGV